MNTTSQPGSRIYRRAKMDELTPTSSGSIKYSRKQAKNIFASRPDILTVEYVTTGHKTDSQLIGKGDKHSPEGVYVIISRTGGAWGKSRRNFAPCSRAHFETASV